MSSIEEKNTKSSIKDANKVIDGNPPHAYKKANSFFENKLGTLSVYDIIISTLIITIFPYYLLNMSDLSFTRDVNTQEAKLLDLINHYKKNEFILSFTGPYTCYILSHLFAYNLRYVSLVFGTGILLNIYLILRRSNIDLVFSTIPIITIGHLPLFQELSSEISVDPIFIYFLTLVIFFWNTLRIQNIYATFKIARLSFVLSILIGLLMSTKFIGFMTWLWIMIISVLQFWNLISDVTLSTGRIIKVTMAKFSFLFTIPLIVFNVMEYEQLRSWKIDSPEYSQYMSSVFQTYLRGVEQVPTTVNYGAVIRIRHLNSLGGYLTSHNETYPGGSRDQLITVSDIEDTEWNKWILEPSERSDINEDINESHHVVLRHKVTGKLLRVSSAKPPISEQEYDKEVSCTGDSEYAGNRDEYWRLETTKLHEPLRNNLKIQLRNIGQNCQLLSHDIRLTSEWGKNEQEVLCVEPATQQFSTWEVIVVEQSPLKKDTKFESFGIDKSTLSIADKDSWKLIIEVLRRQFRYDYFVKNYKLKDMKITQWPFILNDNPFIIHCWFSSIVAIAVYIGWVSIQCIKINPWDDDSENNKLSTPSTLIFNETTFECFIGWLLHYIIFSKAKHDNLGLVAYLPSYIFGEILFGYLIYSLYNWKHVTLTVWVVYLSILVYRVRM
ncbi:similar to Saccharomyces cerevisiae YDR307W Putative protein of unknown function [Maudiozyma saulgeensis]|uniref:dolichyl-phosphate-mannose--protein mannosyltransferase n=1 Tax=Maudiozyma saulgeensis TaxID=1789683 RepID=A0A1X7R5B0_9SACH|nr:similar to Saccharomyces cerevisiae YDR307W Putative protein of unknown function [Kazachstania saulgeensis]